MALRQIWLAQQIAELEQQRTDMRAKIASVSARRVAWQSREAAAEAPYYRRTGRLKDALWNLPTAQGTKITINYPLHIRFLDMKKGRKGKRKKRYAPIYNKYVYGYLKADVHRKLNRLVPSIMINAIEDTFE